MQANNQAQSLQRHVESFLRLARSAHFQEAQERANLQNIIQQNNNLAEVDAEIYRLTNTRQGSNGRHFTAKGFSMHSLCKGMLYSQHFNSLYK